MSEQLRGQKSQRVRGGRHQRAIGEQDMTDVSPNNGISKLARRLIEEYEFGYISAVQVQRYASDAAADGLDNVVIQKLANLATHGKFKNKIAQDLDKFIEQYLAPIKKFVPEAFEIGLKITKGPKAGIELVKQYFVLPHLWFAFVYKHFRPAYVKYIAGTRENIASFWEAIDHSDPRFKSFPCLRDPAYKNKTIALMLHGDGVPCTNNGSLDCLSVESVTAKLGGMNSTSTTDFIYLMTGVMTQSMIVADDKSKFQLTKHAIMTPIIDSFKILETGEFNGELICGGDQFVLWATKGDADFYCNFFDLPGHWASIHPCTSCPAHKDPSNPDYHLNFSESAGWKTKLFDTKTKWMDHCKFMGKRMNALMMPRDQGGLGLALIAFCKDVLHAIDLGVTKHINGNVIWHFVFSDIIGPDRNTNIILLWNEIQNLYRDRGTSSQFGHISISSFTDPGSPNASYPLMGGKGAENRHLIPILATIFESHMRPAIAYERIIHRLLRAMEQFYLLIDHRNADGSLPVALPFDIVTQVKSVGDEILTFYSFLAEHAVADGKLLWNKVSKHHTLWHICDECGLLSPRFGWAYSNEDFMGKCSKIGFSCRHHGPPAYRSKFILSKYTTGMTLRLLHQSS